MAEADDTASTPVTKHPWLTMNRRGLRRLRQESIRRGEEAREARLRPGSNAPPISAAKVNADLSVRIASATYWPLAKRKAALKRLAEIAGRILET